MKRRGVCYDVGLVFGSGIGAVSTRPSFDATTIHRELGIIRDDLHCNAVRIVGRDVDRLVAVAEDALQQGLEVWFSPSLFERSPAETRAYLVQAATAAEQLRERWPEQLVFVTGGELTLFMRGPVPGNTIPKRLASLKRDFKTGNHSTALNAFLAETCAEVRRVFHGQLTYASLTFEAVDWSLFEIVGVDHYRTSQIDDRYAEMLKPLAEHGKPVVVTEVGMRTYEGAESSGALGFGLVDGKTQLLHQLPLIGRFVQPRLKKGTYVRSEALQARELVQTLTLLDTAGIDGRCG